MFIYFSPKALLKLNDNESLPLYTGTPSVNLVVPIFNLG